MADYVELHCHSNYSLLDGASHPETLVERAAELGMESIALTDHDAVYGAVRFTHATNKTHIRPIYGAELTVADGSHLTLLVKNATGWHNLCALISQARHHAAKGDARLPPQNLKHHTDGLIAVSGCRKGLIPSALLRGDNEKAIAAAKRLRDLFGQENIWIELQNHLLPEDKALNHQLVALARLLNIGYVATNNVHYATQDGFRLQDVLVSIKHKTTLAAAHPFRRKGTEYYLKSPDEMAKLFSLYPKALTNSLVIAEQCEFTLRYGLQDLPTYPTPAGEDAVSYLRHLCSEALPQKYPGTPTEVWSRLYYELGVIERAGLANYFLIVWDIVRYARDNGIRGQGRGSAANSMVAYLLNITPVDPLRFGLVFERFLSDERRFAPDIDLDFASDRREEVIQYIYNRYGADHAAMAATFVTYQRRSAVRDVGKALGLPHEAIAEIQTTLEDDPDKRGALWEQLRDLTRQIKHFPRHVGIHNGGFLITGSPITHIVPTEPATMPGRVVVQWDKDGLEDSGLVKIDMLALRILSAISECQRLIKQSTGQDIDLDRLTYDDPAVYEMLSVAETVGVFQSESGAQMQMLPIFKPRCFEDIIIIISLVRPGPIVANMVHPFIRRRRGLESVTYLHPSLEEVLSSSLGVLLWQEQVPLVANRLAGFTLGQGELLRRTLGKKRGGEEVKQFLATFMEGAQARGVDKDIAETVFAQIENFAGYSFPKSHAASFATIVYQSAWLCCYYPAEFTAALLNNQPMGFWSPATIINDAKRRGIPVFPVSINNSQSKCTIERGGVRLGYEYVIGVGQKGGRRIEQARGDKAFSDLTDFRKRTNLSRTLCENLIMAGGMSEWRIPPRTLLWELGTPIAKTDELDLRFHTEEVALPPLTRAEALHAELAATGVATQDHMLALYRPSLLAQGIVSSEGLERCHEGQTVQVAGLMRRRQQPETAHGFCFITAEDEYKRMNIIVRPAVVEKYHRELRSPLLVFKGRVQRRERVINIIAEEITPLNTIASLSPAV